MLPRWRLPKRNRSANLIPVLPAGFRQMGCQCPIVRRPGRVRPPSEAQSTPGTGGGEGTGDERSALGYPGIDGYSRQQRDTQSAGNHLNQRVQAGRGIAILRAPLFTRQEAADGQSLFSEAVTFLEQQQPL